MPDNDSGRVGSGPTIPLLIMMTLGLMAPTDSISATRAKKAPKPVPVPAEPLVEEQIVSTTDKITKATDADATSIAALLRCPDSR